MKAQFIVKRFNKKSQGLLNICLGHIEDYAKDGLDLSVRQLYYRLVAAGEIPNAHAEYKRIVNMLTDARLCGMLDWDSIVDRSRSPLAQNHWDSAADILSSARYGFRLDKWNAQDHYVEVMVEKQALQGVLVPVCKELDVTLTANKGYTSASTFYRAGQRLKRRVEQGKQVHVLYLGDHDPSGIDMTRDCEDRISQLGGETLEEGGTPLNIGVERLALNMPQIKRWESQCPPNPAKETDSRAAGYVSKYGKQSWELDAVEPRELANLVRKAVMKYRNEEAWQASCKLEEEQRDRLKIVEDDFRKKYATHN